jgi:hypothetical protein
VRFRPSFLASSVAAGSPTFDERESPDGDGWSSDNLSLTEQSFSKLHTGARAPHAKPSMGKRIVVAAHAHGVQHRRLPIEMKPKPQLIAKVTPQTPGFKCNCTM